MNKVPAAGGKVCNLVTTRVRLKSASPVEIAEYLPNTPMNSRVDEIKSRIYRVQCYL